MIRLEETPAAEDALALIYDTNQMPVSYDFCWVMAWADLKRQLAGKKKLHVHIIDLDESWTHARPAGHPDHVGREELQWRIKTILWPIAQLLPATTSVSVWPNEWLTSVSCGTEEKACGTHLAVSDLRTIYREVLALAASDVKLTGFRANPVVRRKIGKLQSDSKKQLITATLRQNKGGSARNSDLRAWRSFIEHLPNDEVQVVVVPDTENWGEDLSEHATMAPAAAFDMHFRMALYEAASMNLFVNSGPASLCILTPDCPYLMYKILVRGEQTASTETIEALGFHVGETPGFAGPRQRWVWQDDTADTISREYWQMVADGFG